MIFGFFVIWLSGLFKGLLRLHHSIGGQWHVYLWNLYSLKKYREQFPRGRVDLHDVMVVDDIRKMGMSPIPEESAYANPKKNKSEELFIYGSNTGERTTVQVHFKRSPLPSSNAYESPQDQVQVNFRLDDGKGNVYWLDEQEVRQFSPTEYRAAGFAFEPYEGNRTGRIKFRGYMKRNDDGKLYYVQIRFLCLFFSKTFDHQRLFDPTFLAKELSNESIGAVTDLLENKIEQYCQIKGTFKVESDEEEEFFFLATIGRRFAPKSGVLPRRVIKINGFSKDGHGFQFGLINSGKFTYRYGFLRKGTENFKLLQHVSLEKSDFELLTNSSTSLSFEAKFDHDPTTYRFEVKKYADSRRWVKVDGSEGMAFVEECEYNETEKEVRRQEKQLSEEELANTLVVPFEQKAARLVELTGGKGASLAQLKLLSKKAEWSVPNGSVVTTSAFSLQTNSMRQFFAKLKELEESVKSRKEVEKECQKMVEWFSQQKLDDRIVADIEKVISAQFGTGWQDKLFAVRSSAAMEDSSEMSAAGQMTTYLGVKGLTNVCSAVVKCWASQFAFVPIEYKRGYGQELNSPMAVVIQEMVDCDSAGVIFTANPTDGDERIITVTSNFGLGESVVSASADPDTFQLGVDLKANSYQVGRTINRIVSKSLGKKALVTRMNQNAAEDANVESGILSEQTVDGNQKQSIGDEDVIKLGNIALEIQQHYGNARDIEWGIKDGQFHVFQSRPITNLDSTFTDYELMHEIDSPHMSEHELYSRAHWGENFPGSSSWQANFFFMNGTAFCRQHIKMGMLNEDDFNAFAPSWGYMYNQLMFNLKNGPFRNMFKGYPKSDMANATVFAFFGRHLTDPEIIDAFNNSGVGAGRPMSWRMKLSMPIEMVKMMFLVKYYIVKLKKKIFEENYGDIATPMRSVPLKDKINFMAKTVTTADVSVHRYSSFGSSIKSFILWKLLNSTEDKSHVEHDRNLLMSHCNDVVSAEVPANLQEVARAIVDKNAFAELSDNDALEVLRSKTSKEAKAAELFVQFIKRHGHRGYREMDPLHQPWRDNPIPCVQVIKSLLKGGGSLEPKHQKSIQEVMNEIQTPLSAFKRALIQYWFLPWCRDAVGYRENTKSMMVKMGDNIRQGFRQIAQELVNEGFLPDADLIYYLKLNEIDRLVNGERNPLIVLKARQRKRLYPIMNQFKFDEFVKGFRMRPRPPREELIKVSDDAVCMRGTPVTVGTIKARVCVAETIEEAVNIQQGDILLTYSTDIGWSPYFPLLSGIVTEIGGTVSHGAVIAREYGIPCLIAVEDVCQYFKTGDIAYVDTKAATIVKVQE